MMYTQEEMIGETYIASIMNLIELVYKILSVDGFEKDISSLEE